MTADVYEVSFGNEDNVLSMVGYLAVQMCDLTKN